MFADLLNLTNFFFRSRAQRIYSWLGRAFPVFILFFIDNTFWFRFSCGPHHSIFCSSWVAFAIFVVAVARWFVHFDSQSYVRWTCVRTPRYTGSFNISVIQVYIVGSLSTMSILVYETPLKLEKFAFFPPHSHQCTDSLIHIVGNGQRSGMCVSVCVDLLR